MTLLCVEHLPGCTPLEPCRSCEAAQFLRGKLSKEDFNSFIQLMTAQSSRVALWDKPVEELGSMSVRAANCLRNAQIETIGDLVRKTDAQMRCIPNFGRRSLDEIKELMAAKGLRFGMTTT